MSIHIEAKMGEIAERILLPGDPLRAKYIAETFLEHAVQFNQIRGMLGFTGYYKGQRVSVMGTGMGMPSISIYGHELIQDYDVKRLIRVGTAGSISKEVAIRDLVLAQATATTSSMIRNDFPAFDFPQIADFQLLRQAYDITQKNKITTHVGSVLSEDLFYNERRSSTLKLGEMGIKAVEMEAAALYYLGAKFNVQALAMMTISDSLITGETTTAEERQLTFNEMLIVGLETLII